MKKKVGLVLEGGGLRGNFTSGVLDYFLDKQINIPYVIGVSMGACNGTSYVSNQRGRNHRVNTEFIKDKRYFSYKKLITDGELFGMDFIFKEIPNNLIHFDMDAFLKSQKEFIAVATDCMTGEAKYFSKKDSLDMYDVCKASSSLPFISKSVKINGREYLDGGIIDAIPVKKAIEDGNDKLILVLTQPGGYVKKPLRFGKVLKTMYKKYPTLVDIMIRRHEIYNESLSYVKELEKEGKAFIIQPDKPLNIGRIERNKSKLDKIYNSGYKIAAREYGRLLHFVEK